MNRLIVSMTMCGFALALACGGDDAKNAADPMKKAADSAAAAASNMARSAGNAAQDAASAATDAANSAAGMASNMTGDAVAACRSMAASGAWAGALEVCKKAHEMMPDDPGIEHAYQQAQAAAGK